MFLRYTSQELYNALSRTLNSVTGTGYCLYGLLLELYKIIRLVTVIRDGPFDIQGGLRFL